MNFIEKVKVSASLAGETSNFCLAIKVNFVQFVYEQSLLLQQNFHERIFTSAISVRINFCKCGIFTCLYT